MKPIYLFIFTLIFSFSHAQQLGHEQTGFFISSYDYYNNGEEIEKEGYKELIKDDALAFERFNKHLRNKTWANVFEITGGIISTINLANWIAGNGFSWETVGVTAVFFSVPAYFLNRKADKLLNTLEDSFNDQVGVKFIGNEYGTGIGFRF